ncbi:MAG TPA: TaqI-like C-terminal specificity domain-containing protein [Clostridiales bacterium]|nr:TaqI-like C-terminal specificity domain-containing protein [Clostridiales bacterium]HQP69808.1 TaqI-like C-terminal specificity domain-containing protein [Clostridiales bacterium]
MSVQYKTPKQALKQAYRKLKPTRDEIERFKSNLIALLSDIDEKEGEEHAKNLVRDFLRETYYKGLYEINVKNRNDLVIHSDKTSTSPVCVIIEAKRPSEKYDFPKHDNLNVKAVRELVLYYLRERIDNSNADIKSLIATNGYEWFIFDSAGFYKSFYDNKALVKEYGLWNSGRKDSSSTDMFYKDIAAKYIDEAKSDLAYTYFNIKDYEKFLRNSDRTDDKNLILLYKVLSPAHLLNLGFPNDSNSLDKNFYFELLHIIGLEEVKDGGKKIIRRKEKPDAGSLLENAINILRSEDRLYKVTNPESFGSSKDEQYFGVALELCITWINRILFLKLLEAQLLKYFKGDRDYKFLTYENISNFDELNKLFFQVLAIRHEDRAESVRKKFSKVPYLNSSLFERSGLEDDLIVISNLDNGIELPTYSKTVLRDKDGRKTAGAMNTIEYLFGFLDAYDFSSEGSEEIQEERKTLINASVLGLIFEKINGYKDGSFFTPGFITMYMCRETVRRAVIQKFNDRYKKDIKDIGELKNFIGSPYKKEEVKEYNSVINSLKICDPAVGSGHFLVSALNEIIAVKSELGILSDAEGNILSGYSAFVENDELMLYNKAAEDPFEYIPGSRESQKVQELLFHEKQTIIENCLFGVDINHNSVKICRLRLWIELLKNAYYTKGSDYKQLETLPNIDINIKCGNSLVSRFSLDADLSSALRKSKWTITSYRLAVQSYQNAKTKDEKRQLEKLINEIKNNFRSEISVNDPKQKRLDSLENELYEKYSTGKLLDIELSEKEKAKEQKERKNLEEQINRLSAEIKEIKESAIYRNAFEWRFEFPEVLDEKGNYTGFDVVIGNPPYIRQEELKPIKDYLASRYTTFKSTADIYVYFIERGFTILKDNGIFIFIMPNKWLKATYGKNIREFVKKHKIIRFLDFGDLPVFEEATTYPSILQIQKEYSLKDFLATTFDSLDFPNGIEEYEKENSIVITKSTLNENGWNFADIDTQRIINKLNKISIPLGTTVKKGIYYGIKTGLNEAFIIPKEFAMSMIEKQPKYKEILKPFLSGRDIKRYSKPSLTNYLILFRNGFTSNRFGTIDEETAIKKMRNEFPQIMDHLEQFKDKAKARYDKGEYWWELRACDYYEQFYKEKIMLPDIALKAECMYDSCGAVCANTAYIIPTDDMYLLGLLNSKLIHFFYKSITPSIRGGYLRFIRQYLEQIPVVKGKEKEKHEIAKLVREILEKRNTDAYIDVSESEVEVDKLVYQLYELTDEDIEIVGRI